MKKLNIDELRKEYVGERFNHLTVKDVYYNEEKKRWFFECLCDCGDTCYVSISKAKMGHTKTCGGSIHRKERGLQHAEWLRCHPEVVNQVASSNREWYRNNPDAVEQRSKNHREWWENNRGHVDLSHPSAKNRRASVSFAELLPYIHPDYQGNLLSGNIKSRDFILTKCPKCGGYSKHTLHSIYNISKDTLKYDRPLLCSRCNLSHTSHYEGIIHRLISTFYNGGVVLNRRDIIEGKELDLYYPEKQIAIEFNGDYWHSERFKGKEYHYNKFDICRKNNILLVSIFERDWVTNRDGIQDYLVDLFRGIENSLSFKNNLMNNNYPSLNIYSKEFPYLEEYYTVGDSRVYTCGYSVLE